MTSLASVRHAWRCVMGVNTQSPNNIGGEVGWQLPEAVSIAQRILSFSGVSEEEDLGIVQTEQQEPTGEDMVEEAYEQEREEVEGKDILI